MSYRLIITEKPSVARDIARVLGCNRRNNGYIDGGDTRITWCVGHLLQLAEPTTYNPDWRRWDLATLPMVPPRFSLQPRDTAKDQLRVVVGQLKQASEVINACDAGREGELIFAWVLQHAAVQVPVKRLWISSMTDGAIRDGFSRLRDGEALRPLQDAARCRAEADWLVGLNATRAMTTRFSQGGERVLLSVGRVQTPTLALLCKREDEIEAFEPQTFWTVKARLSAEKGTWEATWTRPKVRKEADAERIFDIAEAEAIKARLQGAKGIMSRVQRKQSKEKPPQLYDLTSLQKEGNKRFGFSAKRTLELAQSLYETHKVLTYPRTDSRHLGQDQVAGLPEKVSGIAFGPYKAVADDVLQRWPIKFSKRIVDDTEVSDHHAIIPTGVDPRRASLNVDEKRIFDLVARRTLAVMMPDAVFAVARIDAKFGEDVLTARGRTCLAEGWRAIDPPQSKKKELLLPPVEKGEAVAVDHCRLHEGTTKPPRRYTEATLLAGMEGAGEVLDDAQMKRAMKRNGLGTPATRAAIIETLLARNYAKRAAKNIVATQHGRQLLRALPVPGLTSPKLTGAWEARLVEMAEGKQERDAFMADVTSYTHELVDMIRDVADDAAKAAGFVAPPPTGDVLGTCPSCGEDVRAGRYGWRCVGCDVRIPGMVARRTVSAAMAKKLLKDGQTKVVKGFKKRSGGEFSAALKLEDSKVTFAFPEPDPLGDCPQCNKPVRHRGKIYTCDTGRSCKFVVFGEMSGHRVVDKDVKALLKDHKTGLLRGLQGRDGRRFDGILAWRDGKVIAVAVDEREAAGTVGRCPRCQGEVRFLRRRWACSACDFVLPGRYMGRPLLEEDIAKLLTDGKTFRLHGFVRNEDGKRFKAALVLGESGRLEVDYSPDAGERPLPKKGPPAAFGVRVDCPCCVDRGELRPGYVIAGKKAWGCSGWRSGCPLKVPFIVGGRRLNDEQGRRLLGKNRATLYAEGFVAKGTARVVMQTGSDPCWTLQTRKSAARKPG